MKTSIRFEVLDRFNGDASRRGLSPSLIRSALFASLVGLALLSGCGGGNPQVTNYPPPSPQVSVTVSPSTASVDQGATKQFSAVVSGSSDQAVTWSIQEGSAGGSISRTGLYTAPAAAINVHVVAASVADPAHFSSAQVTVNTVTVSMTSASIVGVARGRQRQFTAAVTGTVVRDVTWSIEEGAAGGTITADGVYTAPASGGPFHITARSVADPSKAATAAVILTEGGFRALSTPTLVPRANHTATLLPNGKVLIAGGNQNDGHTYLSPSSAEVFDPLAETFSATGSMSIARAGHTATLLNNGTVLIAGGGFSNEVTAEIYDPKAGSFTRVGDMTAGRSWHTASLLNDGRVLIAGGFLQDGLCWDCTPLKTAEIYDPVTQTFSPAGDMPDARALHSASVLLDGKVMMAGGVGNGCPGTNNTVAVFDPSTNGFDAAVNLPRPRLGHTATVLDDGRVLITGGELWDYCDWNSSIYKTAVVFDPSSKSYSPEQLMAEPRRAHSATLLVNGKVLIVGAIAELFDPATSSFIQIGEPNVSGVGRRATRLLDGRVLFTGSTQVAEIYE